MDRATDIAGIFAAGMAGTTMACLLRQLFLVKLKAGFSRPLKRPLT
ncbi:hypothetical protein [Desulforapulum autotrophicum]|nr:hypothetical protein [Desulforapulum autotrophicum]